MRPGCSAVPGGRCSCSSSKLSELREATTSSRPPSGVSGVSDTERRLRRPCSSAGGPWTHEGVGMEESKNQKMGREDRHGRQRDSEEENGGKKRGG